MRHHGRITQWNDGKGYGFVEADAGGSRAFVHIKAFGRTSSRPATGDRVSYELAKDARGRPNASDVRFVGKAGSGNRSIIRALARAAIGLAALGALALAWRLGEIPDGIALWYFAMSACAFVLYGMDKYEAVTNQWRTQESTLHLFGVLGGWPGSLLAQAAFRHKSSKTAFQIVFIATVVANCAGLAWLLADGNFEAVYRAAREARAAA